MKPGDIVTFHPSKHPCTPRPATFVDQKGNNARIRLDEPNGSTRTIRVSMDNIEMPKSKAEVDMDFTPGFRGGW